MNQIAQIRNKTLLWLCFSKLYLKKKNYSFCHINGEKKKYTQQIYTHLNYKRLFNSSYLEHILYAFYQKKKKINKHENWSENNEWVWFRLKNIVFFLCLILFSRPEEYWCRHQNTTNSNIRWFSFTDPSQFPECTQRSENHKS